ncbi:MAG: DNA polymerase III subunit gamma/tau C-terminal domain-containing protein, partial [Halomonas sp.]
AEPVDPSPAELASNRPAPVQAAPAMAADETPPPWIEPVSKPQPQPPVTMAPRNHEPLSASPEPTDLEPTGLEATDLEAAAAEAPAPLPLEPTPAEALSEPPAAPTETAQAAPRERAFRHADWLAGFEALGLGGLTRNLAANCVVDDDDGARLLLRLDPSLAAMHADIHIERIQQALAESGVVRRLVVEEGPLPESLETPRQQAERLAAQRHAEAVAALQRDPHVQRLQQAFGARLIETTVKPADAVRH